MTAIVNCWKDGEFEETVAAALIACYESKVKKLKGFLTSEKIDANSLVLARQRGLYIPSQSRLILNPEFGFFDTTNDTLPDFGCFAFRNNENYYTSSRSIKGYIHILSFAKKPALPKHFYARGRGQLYQIDAIIPSNDMVNGNKSYFTVSKDGNIRACGVYLDKSEDTERLKNIEELASASLQHIADKRFCWTITAKENIAKARLGCMMEEVKSLLYARSLPMTETGRKRPILHLVESHNRRLKNGTDIDVTSFLRGQQTVEIGGTVFSVNPPKAIMPTLSKNSQKFAETSI